MNNLNNYLKLALERAKEGLEKEQGGPFGAVIIDSKGNIVAKQNNTVLKDKDPTAHAEVNAIREACKKMNTYDLSECILYTTCEPCPMCLSAIIWSNIKEVYYGCTKNDAGNIGFRDDYIYEYLETKKEDVLSLKNIDRDECIKLFNEYKGKIY